MKILEDQHERALLGDSLEEAPPGGERLVAALGARVGLGHEPDERTEVSSDPARLALVRQ